MKTMTGILLLAFCVLSGCREEVTQPASSGAMEVDGVRIRKVSVSDKTITLDVTCEVPTPCYTYAGALAPIVGSDISLRVLTMGDGSRACPQVLSSFDRTIEIPVPGPGAYTVQYRAAYDLRKDTVVVVQ